MDRPALCVRHAVAVLLRDQADAAMSYIRNYVRDVFSEKAGKNIRLLYGGGVVPETVHGFLDIPGVDGFLVGHKSINYHDFSAIVESAHRWQRKGEEN